MTSLLAGLLLGVAGSGHCAAMCGPLVVTMGRTLARPSRAAVLGHAAAYHAGRVLTYVAIGIVAGAVGQSLALLGLGRVVAVAGGVVLLVTALASGAPRLLGRVERLPARLAQRACGQAARWSAAHRVAGPLLAGAANGLLPCGLVYTAAIAATALGSRGDAVALMAGFGLGTIPALAAVSMSAHWLSAGLRQRARRLAPVVLALTALLLIARGLAPLHHAPAAHVHSLP